MSFNFTVVKKNQILAGAVTLMLVTAGYLNYKYDPTKPYDVEVTGIIEENLGDAVLVDANGLIEDINLADGTSFSDYIGEGINDDQGTNYIISNDGTTPVFQNNTELVDNTNQSSNTKVPDNTNQSSDTNLSGNSSSVGKNSNSELSENSIINTLVNEDEKVFKEIEDYFISTRIDRTNNYAEQIESYENILNGTNVSEEQKNKANEEIIKINQIRNSIMIAENLIKLKGFEEAVILVNENSVNVIIAADNLTSVEVAQIQSIIVNEFSIAIENVHIINYD